MICVGAQSINTRDISKLKYICMIFCGGTGGTENLWGPRAPRAPRSYAPGQKLVNLLQPPPPPPWKSWIRPWCGRGKEIMTNKFGRSSSKYPISLDHAVIESLFEFLDYVTSSNVSAPVEAVLEVNVTKSRSYLKLVRSYVRSYLMLVRMSIIMSHLEMCHRLW